MANTTISPNMNLPVPTVGQDDGPDWANNLNACMSIIDQHDHTPGSGVQITPAGLNINAALTFNSNNAIALRSVRFSAQSAPLALAADLGCIYESGVDLYYNDGNGNQIRITQSGSVAGSSGTITGLPSGTASASFAGGTFTFQSATSTPAPMNIGPIITGRETAGTYTVTLTPSVSQSGNYGLIWPIALPSVTSYLQSDASGNLSFASIGMLPIGSVIATFPNLAGAYSTSATTTADAYGFVKCNGQTISDGTSPMNGSVVPNINNSVFLMGSTTGGSTAGSNSTTLTTTQLPAHTHTFTSSTSVATSSHTHDFAHVHQWGYKPAGSSIYGKRSVSTSSGSFSSGDQILGGVGMSSGGNTVSFLDTTNANYYTTGTTTDGTNLNQTTGAASAATTVSGTTNSSGTGSAYDSRPLYISAVYLMRIK